jgi:hypothetical protein
MLITFEKLPNDLDDKRLLALQYELLDSGVEFECDGVEGQPVSQW